MSFGFNSEAPDVDEDEDMVYKRAAVGFTNALNIVANRNALLPISMRGNPNIDEATRAIYEQHGPRLLLNKFTELMTQCTDIKVVECLKANHGTLRGAFERSDPTAQCNAIPSVGAFRNGVPCWICGMQIPAGLPQGHPLGPECEHVFPIGQALCFTGLYENSLFKELKSEGKSDEYLEGLTIEYDWSHRVCNQVKNATHFLDVQPDSKAVVQYVINRPLIDALLSGIWTTSEWGIEGSGTGSQELTRLYNDGIARGLPGYPARGQENIWLKARGDVIEVRCKKITDVVTNMGLSGETHALNAISALRAFVASDPNCTIQVENIPTSAPRPFGQSAALTGSATRGYAVAVFEHYVIDFIRNKFARALQKSISQAGRSLPARLGVAISAETVITGEQVLPMMRDPAVADVVQKTRLQLLNVIASKGLDNNVGFATFSVCIVPLLSAIAVDFVSVTGGPQDVLAQSINGVFARFGESSDAFMGVLVQNIAIESSEIRSVADEVLQNKIGGTKADFANVPAADSSIQQRYIFFGARRRKSRKSKSKKQKTLRRKRLF